MTRRVSDERARSIQKALWDEILPSDDVIDDVFADRADDIATIARLTRERAECEDAARSLAEAARAMRVERNEALAVSEGRRKALEAADHERRAEWTRAERAEEAEAGATAMLSILSRLHLDCPSGGHVEHAGLGSNLPSVWIGCPLSLSDDPGEWCLACERGAMIVALPDAGKALHDELAALRAKVAEQTERADSYRVETELLDEEATTLRSRITAQAEALAVARAALVTAHACATLTDDSQCLGCGVSEALAVIDAALKEST